MSELQPIAPAIRRRDVVEVDEEHRRPWIGTVLSVKPTKKGWWVEVRDEERMVYAVPLEAVTLVEAFEG